MFFVDALSLISIVGIWPRFIEPRLLKTTRLEWKLKSDQKHLAGLKILHISDLHFNEKTAGRFLNKIAEKISEMKPDLILFTGDFICYSRVENPKKLLSFLQKMDAPLGSYCVFGNHDYAEYVSQNREGAYDILEPAKPLAGAVKAIKTLCSPQRTTEGITERARAVPHNNALRALLSETPFTFLENRTVSLPIGLNLTGLGEVSLGRCQPDEAFQNYNARFPGIILSHNPDTVGRLAQYPGDWILSGHTHGEQIHIKWPKTIRKFTKKLTCLDNFAYTRGLYEYQSKKIYVTRGLGSYVPFRFGSPPELVLIQAVVHE